MAHQRCAKHQEYDYDTESDDDDSDSKYNIEENLAKGQKFNFGDVMNHVFHLRMEFYGKLEDNKEEILKEIKALMTNFKPAPILKDTATQTNPVPNNTSKQTKKQMKEKGNQTESRTKAASTSTSVETDSTASQASLVPEVNELGCQVNFETPLIGNNQLEEEPTSTNHPENNQQEHQPASNVVIKGIPLNTNLAPIIDSLKAQGINAANIRRLRSVKKNKIRKHVIVTLEEPSAEIYKIKNVCGYFIKCEPLKQCQPKEQRNSVRKKLPLLPRPPPPRDFYWNRHDYWYDRRKKEDFHQSAVNYILDLIWK